MKQPLRILSVIDIPWNSGLAAYAFDQARALREAGHTVVFACPEGSAAMAFAAAEGFKALPIPGRKEHLKLPLALLRLRSAARAEGINAVCAHTGRSQTLGYLLGLPLLRVKADVRIPTAGFTSSAVKRTIAASDYIKELYTKAGLNAGVTVIKQGIDLPAFVPPRTAGALRVGLLGRLDPVKGHEVFLKAAADILNSGAEAEFHIAGYEANLTYGDLRQQAEALDIECHVAFHGKVDGPYKFMASCDIGVIASLGSEAVSRAALEWLASGRPLVSTTAGSLPEFVENDWLVPPGDHEALAARLGLLLADPAAAAALGARNRARAEKDFSQAAFAAATCAAIEEAAV